MKTVPHALGEPDRTLQLVVSQITGNNRGFRDGTGTIRNDDNFTVAVTAEPVDEGDAGSTTLRFELSISSGQLESFSTTAQTRDLSARAADNDYEPKQASIDFNGNAGETRTFEVTVNGDSAVEFDEQFGLDLSWPFENVDARGVIIDDDPGAFLQGRVLRVSGSNDDDSVSIVEDASTITTNVNGVELSFDPADVDSFFLRARAGDDTIEVTSDRPSHVEAAAGRDLVRLTGRGRDRISGGDGSDTIFAGAGSDTVLGRNGSDVIRGGDGIDIIFGDAGSDRIWGEAGPDEIHGNAGRDTILGGNGDDTILGGSQGDELEGGNGENDIDGAHGNDLITGGSESDSIRGGTGADTILGGDGDDSIVGDAGPDRVESSDGDDTVLGGDGNDTILGGAGDDLLRGGFGSFGSGRDRIEGGDGDDSISGFAVAFGDDGNDSIRSPTDDGFASGGDGDDTLTGSGGNDTLQGNLGNDEISGFDGDDSLTGGSGHDYLEAGTGADTLRGGSGRDVVLGGDGIDEVFGDGGEDILSGGESNSFARALIALWSTSDKGYIGRVNDVLANLSFPSSIHRFHDGAIDELNDTGGRDFYLVRSTRDVFELDNDEEFFELENR